MMPDAPTIEDRRKGRKMSSRSDMGMAPYMSDPKKEEYTYEELQRYIADNEGVSAHVRKFIKTFDEIKYYRTRSYKEVQVNEIDALILDINPEYYCKRLGKTNRELIADGDAPIVADDDVNRSDNDTWFEVWEVHHIGQREDSPFAIIPTTDHRIKLSKTFHVDPTVDQNLHGPNFDKQKKIFWKGYMELYDTYGGVSQIPGRHLQTIYQNLNKQKKADKK